MKHKSRYAHLRNSFWQLPVFLFATVLLFVTAAAGALGSREATRYDLTSEMPLTSEVTTGKLENGLSYYIREHKKPSDRAFLRLAVDAGSILENERQRGLAHYLEHMAFNGTESYPKDELVGYLESLGMAFGPDINAYTGFDRTIYKLDLSVGQEGGLKKGFDILHQWAGRISFRQEAIEDERGVILEELRIGRDAQTRMRDQYYPVLFRNSRYAERLPIGTREQIKSFEREDFLDFYNTWYRPELMHVIAVGDFDAAEVERMIRKQFSGLAGPASVPERKEYPVPKKGSRNFFVASDPEASNHTVSLMKILPPDKDKTVRDYRDGLVDILLSQLMNSRLRTVSRSKDAPFLYGGMVRYSALRTADLFQITAVTEQDGLLTGFEALYREALRASEGGFSEEELKRARQEVLSRIDQAWQQRDTTDARNYADELIRHALKEETVPGISFERELYHRYIDTIGHAEIQSRLASYLEPEGSLVLAKTRSRSGRQQSPDKQQAPDKPQSSGPQQSAKEQQTSGLPTAEDLRYRLEKVRGEIIEAYEEPETPEALMEEAPAAGNVAEKQSFDSPEYHEWTLSNGMRLVLKKTNFQAGQVQMTAFSRGGSSHFSRRDFNSGRVAADLVYQSGAGKLNRTQLEQVLAGKQVSARPFIGSMTEGFSGSARTEDMEALLQLIHLYFQDPNIHEHGADAYLKSLKSRAENRDADPETRFFDRLQQLITDENFRFEPMTPEEVEAVDTQKALQLYKERFSNAGDFTFFFVGDFDPEKMENLAETYLASLPGDPQQSETWKDIGLGVPPTPVEEEITMGSEPRSRLALVYTGPYEWNINENRRLSVLEKALSIRLRETIREQEGGTYGVNVQASRNRFPESSYTISITFSCDPERLQELKEKTRETVASLRDEMLDESYLSRIIEPLKSSREEAFEENSFWVSILQGSYFHDYDPSRALGYKDFLDSVTLEEIRSVAQKYLIPDQTIILEGLPKEE
ncbi:MAG: insulinase family protein [Spirochaetales bacterium]|nr:insulinase family protein [Spirochaetales bacterium]MCF7938576.1 insulinase family protein [Spirochaetales bacterium]